MYDNSSASKVLISVPKYATDKILISREVTVTSAELDANGGAYGLFTGIPGPYYVAAVYSYDGGTTWNNIAVYQSNTLTNNPQAMVEGYSFTDGYIEFFVDEDPILTRPFDLMLKYICYMMPNQPDPPASVLEVAGDTLYTSKDAYMKIYKEGTFTATAYGPNVIPHDLGYVPMVRVFTEVFDGTFTSIGMTSTRYSALDPNNNRGVEVDENNLTIRFGVSQTFPKVVHYRIYHEGH